MTSDFRRRLDLCLGAGVEAQLRCDGSRHRQDMFSYFVARRPWARWPMALLRRTRRTPLPAAVAMAHGLRCFGEVSAAPAGSVAVLHMRANERRAISELTALCPDLPYNRFAFGPARGGGQLVERIRSAMDDQRLAAVAGAVRAFAKVHDAFALLRLSELLFYFARYDVLFSRHRFSAAVMSTFAQPHGVAFNLAAKAHGVPVIFVGHSCPPPPLPRLEFEVGVFDSVVARDAFLQAGTVVRHGITRSWRPHYRPMPRLAGAPDRVGVFLAKSPDEGAVLSLVDALGRRGCRRIRLRLHPADLSRGSGDRVARRSGVEVSRGRGVFDDLNDCDVVVAGNTGVHVEAVVSGTPCWYAPGLDSSPDDFYGFVRGGLVPELKADGDLRGWKAFYGQREWPQTLRRYADVDRDPADCEGEVRAKVYGALSKM